MRVADVMQKDVVTVREDATVAEAVAILADAHVSGAPVVNRNGLLIGAISATDLLLAEAEHDSIEGREQLFRDTAVSELMTPDPLTIDPAETVKEAARQMLYADVHRLFVVLDNELLGVISRSDAARVLAQAR